MSRLEVTEKIIATKVAKGLKWSDVARQVGSARNGSPPAASAR
jgi:cyanate lyase